jgi:vancomycin resistance protein YoaR
MTVTAKNIVPAKIVENTQTTQYIATGVTTIIDKFTATNYGAVSASLSVNLVNTGDTAEDKNLIIKVKTLRPAETYTFPELVGQILNPNGFISTLASAATTLNMRVSGREITQ